jgi:hypothetical protein
MPVPYPSYLESSRIAVFTGQLEMTERIYRLNRNDAGHPTSVPMGITRCEQENYLNSFRRYIVTIPKVMELLEAGSKNATNDQNT